MKLLLPLAAVLALAGCDFVGGSDAIPLPIAQIQVSDLRAPDASPDLILEIQSATGRALFRSEIIHDADPSTAVVFPVDEEVSAPFSRADLFVAVYDVVSNDLAMAQLVARSSNFTADDVAPGRTFELSDQAGPARFSFVGAPAAP